MNTDSEIESVKDEPLRIIRTLPPADLEILRDALRKAREAQQ